MYPIPKGLNLNSPVCNAGRSIRMKTTTEWLNVISIMNPAKAGCFVFVCVIGDCYLDRRSQEVSVSAILR